LAPNVFGLPNISDAQIFKMKMPDIAQKEEKSRSKKG
jgi:hypothetical protein